MAQEKLKKNELILLLCLIPLVMKTICMCTKIDVQKNILLPNFFRERKVGRKEGRNEEREGGKNLNPLVRKQLTSYATSTL